MSSTGRAVATANAKRLYQNASSFDLQLSVSALALLLDVA
jgi:hypothetical protein